MKWLSILLIVVLSGCVPKEDKEMETPPGMQNCQFSRTVRVDYNIKYLLYLPAAYNDTDKKWPLILFLHGAGERGDNLEVVKTHGPVKNLDLKPDFEFIVVAPQCPAGRWWTDYNELLIALLEDITARYRVDTERIYLTGLSMGGYGTWSLACRAPEKFAAIAPVCGSGNPYLTASLKDTPVWAFHGAKDNIVSLSESQRMVDAANKFGGNARLTVYPDAGHDSWTQAYNDPELYRWFSRHKKTPSQPGR